VVFVTDGDPNTVNAPGYSSGSSFNPTDTLSGRRYLSNNATGFANAVMPAITAADAIKARSRIFGIGVGPDVANPSSEGRLRQVSGDIEGINPITADYTLSKNSKT
jgi:hypothetical protein